MARYVFRGGTFVDRATGQSMLSEADRTAAIAMPMVVSDIPEYRSPIDGKPITSRSHRREDLKRNNCVEYEPSLSPTKGKFRNKRFAAKHGRQVSEEFR